MQIEECDAPEDCKDGFGCCGGTCCEQKYYKQYSELPCYNDLGCNVSGITGETESCDFEPLDGATLETLDKHWQNY